MSNEPYARRPQSTSTTRRTLMKGATWAAPIAVFSTVAPAYAASFECPPQSAEAIQAALAYTPTTDNAVISNWDQTRSSADAPQVRFARDANGVASAAFLQDDPRTSAATTTTLLSRPMCIAPGTYTFAFRSSLYHANARNVRLTANVVNTATSAVLGNTISFVTTSGNQTVRDNDVITVTVTQRTQMQFRFRWVVDAGGTSGTARFGDDIGVTAPTVRKTA